MNARTRPEQIVTRWNGDALTPLWRSKAECDAHFVIGQIYRLEHVEERSEASHRSFFATINEAWANLPEPLAERFQSPEALRKFALIKCGYATQRQVVCTSNAEAQRLGSVGAELDAYAIFEVKRSVVTIWRAVSQSQRAMGKQRFLESQKSVREFVASLIGVEAGELESNAGQAA